MSTLGGGGGIMSISGDVGDIQYIRVFNRN